MKTLLQSLLLALLIGTGSLAYAESNTAVHIHEEIEEIDAEPYKSIEGKWEVEIEFENPWNHEDEHKFYVYEIDSYDELAGEISDHLGNEFGYVIDKSEVKEFIDLSCEEHGEVFNLTYQCEDDEHEDEELEIEAERYKSIDGKWKIEAEYNDKEVTFYVYNIDNEEELISEVTEGLEDKFGISISDEEVKGVLEIEDDFDEDEDDVKKEEKEDKEEKTEKTDKVSDSEKDELIRLLIIALITILAQSENGSDIDLSVRLENL